LTGTRILWGQILVVLAIVLATTWAATEWTAWRLGFQLELGPPWFAIAGVPLYAPPAFFWWWYHFDAYAPTVFMEGALLRPLVDLPRSRWPSVCRCGGRGKPSRSRPTAQRAGRRSVRSAPRGFSSPMVSYWAESKTIMFATTDRSTCCALRQPAPARVLGS
jgi:hypothetical protein